jgi:hypothetical protein
MEAAVLSETLVTIYVIAGRHFQQDGNFNKDPPFRSTLYHSWHPHLATPHKPIDHINFKVNIQRSAVGGFN